MEQGFITKVDISKIYSCHLERFLKIIIILKLLLNWEEFIMQKVTEEQPLIDLLEL